MEQHINTLQQLLSHKRLFRRIVKGLIVLVLVVVVLRMPPGFWLEVLKSLQASLSGK